MHLPPREARRSIKKLARWAWKSWATRSVAVGLVANVFDIATLLVCVKLLRWPNPLGAAVGVVVGSIFTFGANRYFAFRDKHSEVAPQALKFAATTGVAIAIHAGLVYLLADRLGVPVVLAKIAADGVVFTVGQTLAFRFLVFRKA